MKIGIEEEFIVVDPETLFCSPGAFRLATHVVYKDFKKTYKCSVELPLSSRSIPFILRNLKKAFTVFEIKTEPFEDIDSLHDELVAYRTDVADIADENHLMVLPTGLHPLYSPQVAIQDSCAALHIHTDYKKENVTKLSSMIPYLISVSANSPFFNGKINAISNRLHVSPHVGIPFKDTGRALDLLHNKRLNTIEVRVLDSQITADDSIGLASIVKTISESERFNKTFTNKEYLFQRNKAINEGLKNISITEEFYELLACDTIYARPFLEQQNGSEWQIEVYNKYGLPSVIYSLWQSFKHNKRVMKQTSKIIDTKNVSKVPLLYVIPYSPFFFLDKYKKCQGSIVGLINFIGSMFEG